jgi:small-conductance mechanosensitive channel/CRP-like cAMP-binding protein
MNSEIFRFIMEGILLVLVVLISMSLSLVAQRFLKRKAKEAKRPFSRSLLMVLGSLLFPLFAMGFGLAVLWLPEWIQASWVPQWPVAHRAAWHLFWMVILIFNLLESIAVEISVSSGRYQLPALLRGVMRVVVTALAAFFVLRYELGLNITPLLASTALVTAVVGFALQGVLGNLLAGMSLNLTGSLSKRDWVVVDGVEGQVDEMNWRETWVVTREHIPIRIPNSKVADAHIQNLSRPEGPRRCSVFVDASYDDPPDLVIQSMVAAAAAVPDVRRMPAPTAMVEEYKSYGVGYKLWVWLDRYPQREPIQAEVRRYIWYQFRRAGIQIPYPVSDQVLNQFMERAIVPATPATESADAQRRAQGLLQSDFAHQVLEDDKGNLLIPEEELSAWAGRLSSQRYGRGELIFRQGAAGDCCYVVLSGLLEGKIHHRESGKETTFELGSGVVMGEMSLVTGLPRMADMRVKESAELLLIPAPEFAALLECHPGVLEQLSRLAANRAAANRQQYEDLMVTDAPPVDQAISQDGILQRFWRLLGGAPSGNT